MNDDIARQIHEELRKIRAGTELIVLLVVVFTVLYVGFSGWILPHPVGWQKALVYIAGIAAGGFSLRGMRDQ